MAKFILLYSAARPLAVGRARAEPATLIASETAPTPQPVVVPSCRKPSLTGHAARLRKRAPRGFPDLPDPLRFCRAPTTTLTIMTEVEQSAASNDRMTRFECTGGHRGTAVRQYSSPSFSAAGPALRALNRLLDAAAGPLCLEVGGRRPPALRSAM